MKLLLTLILTTGIFIATEAISASPPARWLWIASMLLAVWRADWLGISGELRIWPYHRRSSSSDNSEDRS